MFPMPSHSCTWRVISATVLHAVSLDFYANTLSSLVSVAKRDNHSSCLPHTDMRTHTQCHLESQRGDSWVIFIVIHVLIYSVMADVKQGYNMQMWVCFSMGIFRSAASSCH